MRRLFVFASLFFLLLQTVFSAPAFGKPQNGEPALEEAYSFITRVLTTKDNYLGVSSQNTGESLSSQLNKMNYPNAPTSYNANNQYFYIKDLRFNDCTFTFTYIINSQNQGDLTTKTRRSIWYATVDLKTLDPDGIAINEYENLRLRTYNENRAIKVAYEFHELDRYFQSKKLLNSENAGLSEFYIVLATIETDKRERLVKAFKYASQKCGAKSSPF